MKINIISVGQFKNDNLGDIFYGYLYKLPWESKLNEIKPSKNKNKLEQKKIDSQNLISKTNNSEIVISLDKSGEIISTQQLTRLINKWHYETKNINFLIGGSEGISDNCLNKSNMIISLGKMTWPHLLVRVMLAEQLYRASTIIANHPYHRN